MAATVDERSAAAALPFPSTWKASLSHWWSNNTLSSYAAQKALVKRGLAQAGIPFFDYDQEVDDAAAAAAAAAATTTTPTTSNQSNTVARLRRIYLDDHHHLLDGDATSSTAPKHKDKERYLNVLDVGPRTRQPDERTFLVLHGYGGAYGFYWQNFSALCGYPNTRVYFIDMLGMGLSGRPKFPTIRVKGDPKKQDNVRSRVQQAEDFFVDSFEQFAKREKLAKFTMIGHSLGGYLSTSYAIQHPDRVNKLVLVSPVGVPRSPYATDEEEEAHMKSHQRDPDLPPEGVEREFVESQMQSTQSADHSSSSSTTTTEIKPKDSTAAASDGGHDLSDSQPSSTYREKKRSRPPSGWWTHLWEANISPFSIVRYSTFFGPKLVSAYASRRFATFPSDVQTELFNYLYSVYGLKGSGEYCLAHLLSPGAYARWPLMDRLQRDLSPKIPVTFIYGENDWMDRNGGEEAARLLKARKDATELVKRRTKVTINPHAGHWVFLDNPEGMNRIFKAEMEEALRDHSSTTDPAA